MRPSSCPRCGAGLRAPDLMCSAWRCDRHGEVLPLRRWDTPTTEILRATIPTSRVPVWAPLPMPPGWTVGGLELVGDERDGACGVALALCGPCPSGGPADVLLVSEEPGVGLAARHAGLDELDVLPLMRRPPDEKVRAAGHPTGLWRLSTPGDRVALAGEAGGVWCAVVVFPAAAEALLGDHVAVVDLRVELDGHELPVGATSPHLV